MKKKLDKETEEVLSEGQRISDFTKSKDWGFIKGFLTNKLIDFDSIKGMELENKTKEQLGEEVISRKGIIDIVLGWVKELEGIAQQHDSNSDILLRDNPERNIKRFED
jgi:hypothetical protein